jgi:hypothetical protein
VLDLFDRRVIAGVCQIGKALAAFLLAVGTAQGWLGREAMFAILFLSGTARAFETSIHVIRACGWGLLSTRAYNWPGSRTS